MNIGLTKSLRDARMEFLRNTATRLRNDVKTKATTALKTAEKEKAVMSDNSQFIRRIAVYDNDNLHRTLFWTTADLEAKLLDFQNYYNGYRTHAGLAGRDGSALPLGLDSYRWQKHCRGLYHTPSQHD